MTDNDDIYFDAQSGISIDEQREILAEINGITEKNKKSLLDAAEELHAGRKTQIKAKKKGILFPLAVNIFALIILAAGIYGLFSLNIQKDTEIKTGHGTYFMAGIGVNGETETAPNDAYNAFSELSREQRTASAIDAYLSGGITVITEYILQSEFDRAAESALELQRFLNTISFETSRPFMSRKEYYVQAIESIFKLIDDFKKTGGDYIFELERTNTQLEESLLETRRSLDALNEGSGGQTRRIVQLEENITEKDRIIAERERTIHEREGTISSLETDKNNLSQTISDLQTVNAEQDREILRLNNELNRIRQALQALTE